MSQEAPPEVIDVGDLPEQRINTGKSSPHLTALPSFTSSFSIAASDPRDVPWKKQNQVSQGQANLNFTDSSGPLFNMYIKMAEEEDNKMADRWQKDADGILIFVSFLYFITTGCCVQHEYCRPVYSLLQSRHWSRSLFKT
jgi:hypothetical protein